MISTQVASWFTPSHGSLNSTDASFLFGGTQLLQEFFSRAAESESPAKLLLVAPFIDVGLMERVLLFTPSKAKQFDLLMLTTFTSARSPAMQSLLSLPWRSAEVRAIRGLHAKMYVVLPQRGSSFALVGSHNLTAAAAFKNSEAGVLVLGGIANAKAIIGDIAAHVASLSEKATLIFDSCAWSMVPGIAV